MARHDTPNHLDRQVFRSDYDIFIVKTLVTQWSSNVHVARYKLLHGAFVRKQLSLSESPMVMTSGKDQSFFITSSVVRAFAHGAMGRRIDPSWGGPIELFLVPASAPRLV